ncbi:hypothetical protein JCM21900_003401 [Sporobolomyces salmonicolor]
MHAPEEQLNSSHGTESRPTTGSNDRRSSLYSSIKLKANTLLQRSKSSTTSVMTVVETMAAQPPITGDGLTDAESRAPSDPAPQKDFLVSVWEQAKGGKLKQDAETMLQVARSATEPLDDRKFLLENIVTMLQGLPAGSPQQPITDTFIRFLWEDLPHPPAAYVGQNFRAADGSGNNPAVPMLGAAGTRYARSVPSLHPTSPNLPDPSVVFDALLKREEFKPHPSGVSSLLFSFATIIIHSCFQTSRTDPSVNEASSYLDLSPLYGNNLDEQATVRTYTQGLLYPDVIASSRLFFMPPSVVALLVVFSRNHNFIADMLFKVNERGKYKPLDQLDDAGKRAQDESIFQIARLVNCGWFLQVVVQDYIRTILNINQTESTWSLAPNNAIRSMPSGMAPRGVGNAVSAEFNILYRWHSAISKKDELWLEGLFKEYCGDKPVDQLTEVDFGTALSRLAQSQGKDPKKWSIPGITRTESGRFNDDDLAKIISDATEEVAGAFGANGSPAVMKIIDVLGMATARNDWNICTMNEFRRFLNLKPFATFEEWNSDPKVANIARKLYGHPSNIELFPGLHAEEAKPSESGSGLAVNYTISRGILSDAVALVRGDRFFTTDFNAANLTSWGFEDVQPDPDGGSYGGVIGKLLMRNLPTIYTPNSAYALFPFSTPETMRKILQKNGVIDKYDISRPTRVPPIHGVFTYKACMDVLADSERFGVTYKESIESCSNSYGFFISFDDQEKHRRDRQVQEHALFPTGWQDDLRTFYSETTARLIKENSWSYDRGKTQTLDVVRDVTNLASVYWVAWQFGMPLKEKSTPHGLFTPQELYLILSAFFASVFMNFDSSSGFKLTQAAKQAAPALLAVIRMRICQVKGVPVVIDDLARSIQDLVLDKNAEGVVMGKEAREYYTRLLESDRPLEQLEASVQSTMTASVSNQGQAAAQVLNFFLEEENAAYKEELVKLCKLDTPEADTKILSLVSEAMRFDPQVPLIPRVAKVDATIQDGDTTISVKKGDKVFPSMLSAGMDPSVFLNPDKFEARDPSLYRLFGFGMHGCLGARIVNISMVQMIKQVFKLPNVRRAPGKAGQLQRFHQEVGGTSCPVYLSANSTVWPLPVSLSIVYDVE